MSMVEVETDLVQRPTERIEAGFVSSIGAHDSLCVNWWIRVVKHQEDIDKDIGKDDETVDPGWNLESRPSSQISADDRDGLEGFATHG